MAFWEQWVRRPQNLWIRKALFQVHLWTGIGAGLYILAISISGSIIVYRPELLRAMDRNPYIAATDTPRMNDEGLESAAKRQFPDYTITQIFIPTEIHKAAEVWFQHDGKTKAQLYNPYTGADLGSPVRQAYWIVSSLVEFHDDLLAGSTGRYINGIGAILATLLCLTGIVIWWPGIKNWRRSFTVNWKNGWKRWNWDLHSAIGVWFVIFVLTWGVSGIYLCFPRWFDGMVDFLNVHGPRSRRFGFGDNAFLWLSRLHFGRYGGWSMKATWAIIGLVPAALFVTGALMWWNRVLRKAWRRYNENATVPPAPGHRVLIGKSQQL